MLEKDIIDDQFSIILPTKERLNSSKYEDKEKLIVKVEFSKVVTKAQLRITTKKSPPDMEGFKNLYFDIYYLKIV